MSVLKVKLDKAAQQFQTHNFRQSLALYEDCLAFCYRTQQSQSLIYNIMTTKGALLSILGQLQKAMSTLNQVLRNDSNNYLGLIRRSQVYKKRGKLNRALKDLEMVSNFCPDNLQIAAMKIEIQNMKSKSKVGNSSEQSESEEDEEFNEELQLNFINLKKIDRKSCSILLRQSKARESRVSITGDITVEYEREEDGEKSYSSTQVSKQQLKQKLARTSQQIQKQKDVPAPASNIVVKPNARSKSILKNKNSIFGSPNLLQSQNKDVYLGRESKLIEKLKDIDGKIITSNHSIQAGSNKSVKQVQFKKSIFASQQKQVSVIVQKKTINKKGRKSCLKRSSFQVEEAKTKQSPAARRSKFEVLTRKSIDGAVIKNHKSVNEIKMESEDKSKNEQDSDKGSSYNIFGNNDNVMISKGIKEKLGISFDENKEKKTPKQRATRSKSILKKNSVLIQNSSQRPQREQCTQVCQMSEEKVAKKPKKSVIFTKSRFAQE